MEGVCIFLYNFLTVAENAWQTLESIEIDGNADRAGPGRTTCLCIYAGRPKLSIETLRVVEQWPLAKRNAYEVELESGRWTESTTDHTHTH